MTERDKPDKLIINSPFEEPARHWSYRRETRKFSLKDGRRPAGYVIATEGSKSFDDPGVFVEIEQVNKIRPRVREWREGGYAGASAITRRLLEYWNDPEEREGKRFFFCQIEAIETLLWLVEGPEAAKTGIGIKGDGGPFKRLCSKLATGTGKTVVMAMAAAWQILNKITNPQDTRFSKHIFIVAPGLTVKSRLRVLDPSGGGNYYEEFRIVPGAEMERLRQGKVIIRNWHTLNWESAEKIKKKKGVDKRGAKSDEAYVREVLGGMASAKNIVVFNDEAHHAWRVPSESKVRGVKKEDIEEATKWVGGLDRINKARGILNCFDFSATPFAPSGNRTDEEALFSWIVSDFGLNDAIEAGLVKTPRVVVRDDSVPDATTYKPKLYHIFKEPEVKDDLNRKAEPEEPLPDLVVNAYYLLGLDWRAADEAWKQAGHQIPPVMITVANNTNTAARVKYSFDRKKIRIDELCNPDRTLHIDSKVLDAAEALDEPVKDEDAGEDDNGDDDKPKKLTKKEQAEKLRQQVDTVGQMGKPGELIQNVISVGMLSEGWDAKTVTHIMGLRAFTSQLLCEQVVGRGLRRTAYEANEKGLFEPEYVNIFGVPFTFMPHEGGEDGPPPPPQPPKTKIEPVDKKREYEIRWPNIVRINRVFKPRLTIELEKVAILELNAAETATIAQLAPVVEGKPDLSQISEIDLQALEKENRTQKIVFETVRDVYDQLKPDWKGKKEYLIAQLIKIVDQFMVSDRIKITPELFNRDDFKRRLVITLNMNKAVQHICKHIRQENSESLEPVFDVNHPIRSTGDCGPWWTGKPCEYTNRSHISHCVFDSAWEASEAFETDRNENVAAWVKNDHIGFEIYYVHKGVVRKYRPDFIIRLATGEHLILETKGQDTDKDKTKREYLDEWVAAVNGHGGFGKWIWAVSTNPSDIKDKLDSGAKLEVSTA